MFKRIKILLVLVSLSITLCLMSNTYSRYVANTTGNIDVLFAKWQLLINDTDITNQEESSLSFTPVVEANANVASNVIAPSSKGYFDVEIDPTNVDVSFSYSITLSVDDDIMPDLLMTKYVIIPADYDSEVLPTEIEIVDGIITNDMLYDNSITDFRFQPFTVRIYFEWYEGVDEEMNDISDTSIGTNVVDTPLTINASINFEQIIS